MKRYKSVDEMITKTCLNKTIQKWFLHYIQRKRHPDEFPVYSYQEVCRFYLDDEQKELREEWYCKKEARDFGVSVDYLRWAKKNLENAIVFIPGKTKFKKNLVMLEQQKYLYNHILTRFNTRN